jgi:homoserine dehydrogenase
MAEHGISLERIVQRRRPGAKIGPRGAVPVVLITHATHEKSVRQALKAAVAGGFLADKRQVLRIERE